MNLVEKWERQVTTVPQRMNLNSLPVHGRSFNRTSCVMRAPLLFFLALMLKQQLAEEIWEHDLSTDMQIGASTEGYEKVALNCDEDRMIVQVETSKDFSGVIYTQGSFHSRQSPCFIDPDRGGNFTLTIPFNKCGIKKEGDRYKNILVLQHDDELIIPGDAAFILECESKSELESNQVKREIKSSVSLVDADPGRDNSKKFGYAASYTKEVVFAPKTIRVNDEL